MNVVILDQRYSEITIDVTFRVERTTIAYISETALIFAGKKQIQAEK